jgi:L-aspartate oxidase
VPHYSTDILIIGSGIAGLSLALKTSQYADVLMVTKKASAESATNWAQGGIATVTASDDETKLHVEDTIRAGAGLCEEEVVQLVVETAPERIRELMEMGVSFTRREDGSLALGREGGHCRARILHHRDQTGQEIETVLLGNARSSGRIEVLEHHVMVDLLVDPHPGKRVRQGEVRRCFGAYVLDEASGQIKTIAAKAVMLATGGSGMVYQHTSNPTIATGDGLVAAWRAGADVADLEFFQFHPTTLMNPETDGRNELITEAMRGHGAILRTQDGAEFMKKYDDRGELASRDIVARAIDAEMKKRGETFVWLDCTHLEADGLRNRFPHIDEVCRNIGIDFTKEPIPVVPAAHYQCGGVVTDIWGRTTLAGLFAVGEVAMTGLHGANRLASNSLLEAIVFAHQASQIAKEWLKKAPPIPEAQSWSAEGTVTPEEFVLIQHNRDEIRRLMWNYVGIVRSTFRLERAARRLQLLTSEVADFYRRTRINGPLIELRNLVILADLIVRSASGRHESRGLHFMLDYPEADSSSPPRHTVMSPYSSENRSAL